MQSSKLPVSFFLKRVCQSVSHCITPTINRGTAYPPVLLARKAKSIMKGLDAEKGPIIIVRTVYESEDRQYVPNSELRSHSLLTHHSSWKKIFGNALIRPFFLFARESIVQLLGLYMAFIYGLLYCAFYHSPVYAQI